ncbi:hypothetical protein TNCV_4849371 [Trichonephila clavipes]|nr:hypothetical protein TNCV_4849371 [Trichonephila clavipes]
MRDLENVLTRVSFEYPLCRDLRTVVGDVQITDDENKRYWCQVPNGCLYHQKQVPYDDNECKRVCSSVPPDMDAIIMMQQVEPVPSDDIMSLLYLVGLLSK